MVSKFNVYRWYHQQNVDTENINIGSSKVFEGWTDSTQFFFWGGGVKCPIVTWSNLDVTWKVTPHTDIISWFPLRLCWFSGLELVFWVFSCNWISIWAQKTTKKTQRFVKGQPCGKPFFISILEGFICTIVWVVINVARVGSKSWAFKTYDVISKI